MARNAPGDRCAENAVWAALAVFLLMLYLAVRSLAPPDPLPSNAPANTFSGERAAATLARLLGDETPHPVGSAANRAVRDRLVSTLEGLGLTPEIQRTVGCHGRYPLCARVENVLAEIPGQTRDALVIMAHYDSVPHAPGAADDGSGVVTLLESARALVLEPARRNRILLVFTDAEEMGLLGAEGFFADHPWVADVKAVINVEGSGSGGPSLLLRSSNPGGHLLAAYRRTAPHPQAISYSQEVFARMPNDTDFTVPDRAGIPGIDFAFAFEFNHYHTPLDSLANLDRGTLQHHGDNVLPLARELAALDLSRQEPNFSYFTAPGGLWITWPAAWTVPLAVLALVGLAAVSARLRGAVSIGACLGGFALALAGLLLSTFACYAVLWVADLLVGTTVSYPANPWPWRLTLFAGAWLPVAGLAWWARGRLSLWARFLGPWWLLGLLALVLAVVAPLAANLLMAPVLMAVGIALAAVFAFDRGDPRVQGAAALLALAPLAYLLMSISYSMEEVQGYGLAPTIYGTLVLTLIAFLPFRHGGRLTGGLAAVVAAGWLWTAVTPLYSEWRPQHVSLYHVLDLDEQTARWAAITANPLPRRMIEAFGTEPEETAIVPWAAGQRLPTFPAETAVVSAPDVSVDRQGTAVRVRLRSAGSGDHVQLVLPETAGIDNLRIAGTAVPAVARDGWIGARFYAAGGEPVEFTFTITTSETFTGYVVDGSHTLPGSAAPFTVSRGRLAVPRHQGDQRIAFQRIEF